jgi:hypothetical protein
MVTRNIRNITPTKNQGPSFNPRPRAGTGAGTNNLGAGIFGTRQSNLLPSNLRGVSGGYAPTQGQSSYIRKPVGDGPTTDSFSTDSGTSLNDIADTGDMGAGPSRIDWRDSSYNSQIAALEEALRKFETGSTTRGERYEQDYSTGLGRLGYIPAPQPMMATRSMADGVEEGAVATATAPAMGRFDINAEVDRTSAAARGTRGMRDEFAGRGMLRSSDFTNSFADFQNRLQQQYTAMEEGRRRFKEDSATELADFRTRTEQQRAAAEESARNRAIMQSLSQAGF